MAGHLPNLVAWTVSDDQLLFSALDLEQNEVTGQGSPQGWLVAS